MIHLVIAVAFWRLTHMVQRERGLFRVFEILRMALGLISEFKLMLECFWCTSFAVALVVFGVECYLANAVTDIWKPFYYSGSAILVQALIETVYTPTEG